MLKTTWMMIGVISTLSFGSSLSFGENFQTAFLTRRSSSENATSCPDKTVRVYGKINYKELKKSGDLGFHHCVHKKLRSNDFPEILPGDEGCEQVSQEPEAISIFPPLPQSNERLLTYGRINPAYVPEGTTCSVTYTQYYYRP